MKLKKLIFITLILCSLTIQFISAEVGVGISPSRIIEQVSGGEIKEIEFLVFNTGTDPIKINLVAKGDIANFVEIVQSSLIIEPEPKPHELPIKNGKAFNVKFDPPVTRKTIEYEGTISAIGSSIEGSNFGGSVGVASQVKLIVVPPESIFSFIKTGHIVIVSICLGIIILLIIIFWFLKRAGLKIGFKKKKK